MKFYIATDQRELLHTPLIGPTRYRIQLMELFILSESGYFLGIEGINHYNPKQIENLRNELQEYFAQYSPNEPIELVIWGTQNHFTALSGIFGGVNGELYPSWMPRNCTDIGQTIIELMDLMDDDEFGVGTEHCFIIEKADEDNYTARQKMEMFLTHKDCPEPRFESGLSSTVYYNRKIDAFVHQRRKVIIDTLKLSRIQ